MLEHEARLQYKLLAKRGGLPLQRRHFVDESGQTRVRVVEMPEDDYVKMLATPDNDPEANRQAADKSPSRSGYDTRPGMPRPPL